MNEHISPEKAELCAERLCACTLSQVKALSHAVLRVAAQPALAPDSGCMETEDGYHRWVVSPLMIPSRCMAGLMVKLEFAVPMRLERYEENPPLPSFPAERLSAVARRAASWLQHPQLAEDLLQTWRRAARTENPMNYHLVCDPDGYAYAVSIRFIPAKGERRMKAAAELLVMERLDACWCPEALQEEGGELKPRFCAGTEELFYRPCILEGMP